MNLKPPSRTLDLTDTDQWNGVSMTEGSSQCLDSQHSGRVQCAEPHVELTQLVHIKTTILILT